jgi:hypothetical protein
MNSEKDIRASFGRVGVGSVYENSGEVHENVEIFAGTDPNIIFAIKRYAAIQKSEERSVFMSFHVSNLRRFQIKIEEPVEDSDV